MTELRDILKAQIATSGPMNVAQYMATCLLHPKYGYYTNRDPLGVKGDFTTSPEISQMFGELIGLSLAQCWLDQGAPAPIALAELGPGRGTLMADILRATARVPGFHDALSVHLVEASPVLRNEQKDRLNRYAPTWHDDVTTLPEKPLFLVANEFFDALPIRQFLRDGPGWRERVINVVDGDLAFGLTTAAHNAALTHRIEDTRDGDLVETCTQGETIMAQLGNKIAMFGGAALVIDYGDWCSLGDTLQAVARHQVQDVLATPGQVDLTAHVDFETLTKACGCAYSRLTPQGVFLERLGITQRAQSLAAGLTGDALQTHVAAHRRLTHPDEMGKLFKIIGFFPNGQQPPPGVET